MWSHPQTDPAAGAAAPGVGAPVGAVLVPRRLGGAGDGVGDTGDADPRQVGVIPGGTDVGGVGGGAGATRFVTGEQEEVVEVEVSRLPEGVVFLGRDTRRVALSSPHHLESKVSVYMNTGSSLENRRWVLHLIRHLIFIPFNFLNTLNSKST